MTTKECLRWPLPTSVTGRLDSAGWPTTMGMSLSLVHEDVGFITVQAMPLARSRGIGWWKGAERRDEQEPAHPRGLGCLDQVQVSGLVD